MISNEPEGINSDLQTKFYVPCKSVSVPEAPILTVTSCTKVATGTKLNLTCESSIQKVETFTFYRKPYNQEQTTLAVQENKIYEEEQVTTLTFYFCTVTIQGNTISSPPSNVQAVTVVGKYILRMFLT